MFLSHFQKMLHSDVRTFQKMLENKKEGTDFYEFLQSLIGVKKVLIKYVGELADEKLHEVLTVRSLRPKLLKSSNKSLDLKSLMFIFYNIEYDQAKFIRDKFIPQSEKESKYKKNILELYEDVIEQIGESYDFDSIRPLII